MSDNSGNGGRAREGRSRREQNRLTDKKESGTGDPRPSSNLPRGDGRPSTKPQIGDSRPAPKSSGDSGSSKGGDGRSDGGGSGGGGRRRRRRRGNRGRGGGQQRGGQQGRGSGASDRPVEAIEDTPSLELDEKTLRRRRGRERRGKPIGRYLMCVSVGDGVTQLAILEGRALIEHYVSRPADDANEIHGNVYQARVQNVLPGMEAAFVDIGTPKNAVLYRGDVQFDADDVEGEKRPRIEQALKAKQRIIAQVTKNPIAHKGARLTQEISLPGRYVVLVPNSTTYGISKRLPDGERRRLRSILDQVKPADHGIIVRTAAEGVTEEEIGLDIGRLAHQWDEIESLARRSEAPALLYREPELVFRYIREEFNRDFRGVLIDDRATYEQVRAYAEGVAPALVDRISHYDLKEEKLPLFERHHVQEQLRKTLDPKVWLASGGSLVIERTEALTVIDVNTGKNVGKSSLEETVLANNLEAAEEVARQLRLRDIGGIIVIDFVDMDVAKNRDKVAGALREALSRDKTRTQVFDISELGLVEMTRKRIGEGLLESFTSECEDCEGRGRQLDESLLAPGGGVGRR